jgi:DNA-binding response OmpR family regulator
LGRKLGKINGGTLLKILIVEDESRLAEVLRRGLREEGFAVEHAANGLRGEEMIMSAHYDAVVLDVMLPGLNGFDVLRRIRAKGSKVPVLILTARSGLDDRVRGLDLGADDYLPKPFAFKELMARLRAISRRPAVEPQNRLLIADLEIQLGSREVRRGGKLIDLSSREFALLEFLVRRKGLVLTRSMILDHVWASDYDYDGGSNLVDVYINYLRKKVDHGNPIKLIHTVRGAGYVLREPSS